MDRLYIPDYFPDDNNESRYPSPFPFSMIIVEISRCRKTNELVHLLLNDFFEYDKMYCYGLNPIQKKIQGLKNIFDTISKKLVIIFLTFKQTIIKL